MAKIIGYARLGLRESSAREPKVSGFDAESQIAELRDAGATTVFAEGQLSKDADRPELRQTLDTLTPGDTLVVVSLDRLARTPTELFYILEEIEKRGATLRSLRENLVLGDGGATKGEPQSAVAGDEAFMRHLGIILDFERSILREWQHESIDAAKSRRDSGSARRHR